MQYQYRNKKTGEKVYAIKVLEMEQFAPPMWLTGVHDVVLSYAHGFIKLVELSGEHYHFKAHRTDFIIVGAEGKISIDNCDLFMKFYQKTEP